MKSSSALRLLFLAALAPAAVLTLAAKDETPAAAKMPVLKKDFSPIGDGKTPVVASYADIVEPVEKEVVSIDSSRTVHEHVEANPLLRQFFGDIPDQDHESKEMGLGSGVIVSSDGFILTNNHVVADADELTVVMSNGSKFTAKVVGADPKTDIAIVKIDAPGLPCATFADSDKLRGGDVVFAVGNPLGVGETVTMGIVSAKSRNVGILDDVHGYEDFIQTDAAINMGNSGGALVDAKGRFVGINSAIVSPSRGNIGIGFAIPVNMAVSIMKSLIETGTVTRGFLGVGADPVTPDIAEQVHLPKDAKGVIVNDLSQDGPAEKAGLKRGDVILAVDGKGIESQDELRLTISQMAPGSAVALDVSRDGKPMTELLVAAPDGREMTLYEADFIEGLALQAAVALESTPGSPGSSSPRWTRSPTTPRTCRSAPSSWRSTAPRSTTWRPPRRSSTPATTSSWSTTRATSATSW